MRVTPVVVLNNRTARNAALLVGIPTDFGEFSRRIGDSDWLSRFDPADVEPDERAELLKQRWESEYAPLVAEPVKDLIKSALDLRVDVREQASLRTLCEVTKSSDCVILFCHWKGHEILVEDVVPGITSRMFLSRVTGDTSELGLWLQNELRPIVDREEAKEPSGLSWWRTVFRSGEQPKRSLVDVLSEAVEDPAICSAGHRNANVDLVLESTVSIRARKRERLDELFSGYLHPGNRLELFDGLHPKETIESAVSSEFQGTLDLTTCTSTILGDYISAKRNHRVRTVQFDSLQEFAWQAQCVSLALEMVADQPITYQQARAAAAQVLRRAVLETTSGIT